MRADCPSCRGCGSHMTFSCLSCDLFCRQLTDISILNCYVHIRYLVYQKMCCLIGPPTNSLPPSLPPSPSLSPSPPPPSPPSPSSTLYRIYQVIISLISVHSVLSHSYSVLRQIVTELHHSKCKRFAYPSIGHNIC